MKKFKLLSLAAVALLGLGAFASCTPTEDPDTPVNPDDPDDPDTPDNPDTPEPELETVRVGLHTNLGAGAGYSAYNQGFMEEEGINMEVITGGGPALATSVVEGNLDVSFMGGGVAYHYFAEDPKVKIVALDNLTDDDRLLANPTGPGANLTLDSSLEEIGNALKGATLALDQTKTPAQFFSTLLDAINAIMPDGEDVWYTSDTGEKLPLGLPSYSADCEIIVSQADNANLATSASSYDFVICFAPSTTLITSTGQMKEVCKTSTHFSDSYAPSTWAVNVDWLETHEETFKKFMRGLVKGMNFRRDHTDECTVDIEDVTSGSVPADSLATDIAIWLGDEEQIELYENGKLIEYTNNILEGQRTGNNADLISPDATAENSSDFSYIYEAAKEILGE